MSADEQHVRIVRICRAGGFQKIDGAPPVPDGVEHVGFARLVRPDSGKKGQLGGVGGVEVVGSAAVATNKGVLAHPRSSDDELETLDDLFGVNVNVGTINYGTPLVGSGLLANTKGYVAGAETTGPELGRIEETLGFV